MVSWSVQPGRCSTGILTTHGKKELRFDETEKTDMIQKLSSFANMLEELNKELIANVSYENNATKVIFTLFGLCL